MRDAGPRQLPAGRRLLFTAVVALGVLACIELSLQLFYRVSVGDFLFRRAAPPIFEADPHRCYRVIGGLDYEHRTNEFTMRIYTNSEGLRTDARRREVGAEPPPGGHRILFLGPSFAFGWGSDYEDSYAALLGERLAADAGPVEVVNAGTPAQGPEAQLCWLAREGRRLRPDLVVQTLYGQDVPSPVGECPDPLPCPVVAGARLYFEAPTPTRRLIGVVKNLAGVFYGYTLYHRLAAARQGAAAGEPAPTAGKELHGARARSEVGQAGDVVLADFARFERFVREHVGADARVAFLFVPLSYMVHPQDAPRWTHLGDVDPERDLARLRTSVAAVRAAGHTLIDPTDALRAQAGAERLYYWLDVHLTPAGNRVVADAAAPALRDLLAAR
jgi:hypothetical protein